MDLEIFTLFNYELDATSTESAIDLSGYLAGNKYFLKQKLGKEYFNNNHSFLSHGVIPCL